MKKSDRIPPIRISDNIYWVGVNSASPAHLITTSEGIVLIDTASHNTVDEFIENIESLGFSASDVRHIIHSHAHFDHVGATPKIVSLSGAKTYLGRRDYDSIVGNNKRLWAGITIPQNEKDFYFEPDVLLDDGDELTVGDVTFRFLSTPGHTEGVMSIFWNTTYRGQEHLAGMFGGAGTGAMSDSHLQRDSLSVTLREDFVRSIDRIINEPVTLHIGNHPSNNNHSAKAEKFRFGGPNPFIYENTWQSFLMRVRNEIVNSYDVFGKAKSHTVDSILDEKVIVILRGFSDEELVNTVAALSRGGIHCCEVTYDSRGDIPDEKIAATIKMLCDKFPEMHIGAGTVLTEKQVILTAVAGGRFIVSPDTNPDVIAMTARLGLVSVPGALTPSEVTLANRSGADFVKMFPIGEMGSSYLKALAVPLSHVRLLAVGGVDHDNVGEYLNAGACGIGIATAIANKTLIRAGKYDEVSRLASDFLAKIKASIKK